MGLAPQIVEEIFEIVQRPQRRRRACRFLLAEQNTNIALRYAGYGYILENGRVVMDGDAKALRENEDVKEFYLGVAGGERKSFRDVKSLQAPQALAGVNDRPIRRPARNPRSRRARARAVRTCCPTQMRPRDGQGAGLGGASRRASILPSVTSRPALAKLPVLRKSDAHGRCKAKNPPFGGFTRRPPASWHACSSSPGPIFEPEGRGADWWRTARAPVRRRLPHRRPRAQHLRLSPHARRLDARGRRAARSAAPSSPRGTGKTEQQLDAIAIPEAQRLCRHARLSEDPARQGQGGRQGRVLLQEGPCRRRVRCSASLRAEYKATRHRRYADATPPPTSASSPTRAPAREGMIVDEGVIVEIVRPGTGDPGARRARSARWSSPPSTATIR